jgi:hypothetical protein
MADAIRHIDLDDEQFEDAPKALREYAKKLRAKLAEAEAMASKYRHELAARAVKDLVGEKGFANPARVEKALLADDVDPLDASAVKAWLADNGDGYATAAEPEECTPAAQEVQFHPEQDQFERWLEATGQSTWSASTPTTERQDQ